MNTVKLAHISLPLTTSLKEQNDNINRNIQLLKEGNYDYCQV